MIRYRVMTERDIAAGLRLCRAAGWNQVEDDWRIFLRASPEGNLVAERDDAVIGTVATLPYGPFTWVSMVLVDRVERNRGLGTALLEQALELIGPNVCARLDATPAGQPLYERLGFEGEYEISRMTARVDGAEGFPAMPMTGRLVEEWAEIDADIFGANRGFVLRDLFRRAPQYARVAAPAYSFGRPGHVYDQIGPIAGKGPEAAAAVVEACLQAAGGRKVVIDAPGLNPDWLEWLEARGFREERRLLRMSRGWNPSPGMPGDVFAIAGPELG